MILAATVGMACLSAVAGALIINFAGEQSLTPCHSAYAGAVGFCIYICLILVVGCRFISLVMITVLCTVFLLACSIVILLLLIIIVIKNVEECWDAYM
jgi:hypothetical protein